MIDMREIVICNVLQKCLKRIWQGDFFLVIVHVRMSQKRRVSFVISRTLQSKCCNSGGGIVRVFFWRSELGDWRRRRWSVHVWWQFWPRCDGGVGAVIAVALTQSLRWRWHWPAETAASAKQPWHWCRYCSDGGVGVRQRWRCCSDCSGVGLGFAATAVLACGATAASAKQLWRCWHAATAVLLQGLHWCKDCCNQKADWDTTKCSAFCNKMTF